MDPLIWSKIPYDLLELIASFADIDSRRALGFKPRKLVIPDLDMKFSRKWRYDHVPIKISKFQMAYILTATSRICVMLGRRVSIFDIDNQVKTLGTK